eukprot:231381_1
MRKSVNLMSNVQDLKAIVHNVQDKPHWNGALAIVGEFIESKQRYQVKVEFNTQWIKVLLPKENLIFVNNIYELINTKNLVYSQTPCYAKTAENIKQQRQQQDDEKHSYKLHKSDIVLIHSLKNATQFNNLFGEIVDYKRQSKRYQIKFEYNDKICNRLLKASNLRLAMSYKYSTVWPKVLTPECVVCSTPNAPQPISSDKLLTCPGCASLHYCSKKCRNHHLFEQRHLQLSCYQYKHNMLYSSAFDFNYILGDTLTDIDKQRIDDNDIADYGKYLQNMNRRGKKKRITKMSSWEDWMKYYGFQYESAYNHSYPMTFYYILKKYFKIDNWNKDTINIYLISCKQNEFTGVEWLAFDDVELSWKLADETSFKNQAVIDAWKWRWNIMGKLLLPLKLNIKCFGDEIHEKVTGFETNNLKMEIRRELYLPDVQVTDEKCDPDIVIGLHAGIHNYTLKFMPVLQHCIKHKIPMMFTESDVLEFELFIRETFDDLGMQNNIVTGFNPFRDVRVWFNTMSRRAFSMHSFLYGITQY